MTDVERVIVASIDALRADHLPMYGYERDTAPFLSDLAGDNLVFENCYSTSSHTREAFPTMVTGQRPWDAIDESYDLMGTTVAARTDLPSGLFHSNPFISRSYGYDAGFTAFDDDLRTGGSKLLTLARRAIDKVTNRHYARGETINARSVDWIDSLATDRFLLWNHYMDVHGPYQPPRDHARLFTDSSQSNRRSQYLLQKARKAPSRLTNAEHSTLVDLYDGEIHYTDEQLRSLVEALRERGLYEDALLVITADHGEALGEDGFYEHPRRLTQGLLRVPMILAGGRIDAGSVEPPVSTLDLAPTILGAFGVEHDDLPGRNLSLVGEDGRDHHDSTVFAETSDRRSTTKRFAAATLDGFATASVDPDAESMRVDGDERPSEALESFIGDREASFDARRASKSASGEVERRLEALGYRADDE